MTEPPELTIAVARTMQALRADRGWSLDQLAARSGVSKGVLVALRSLSTQLSGAQVGITVTNPNGTTQTITDANPTTLTEFGISLGAGDQVTSAAFSNISLTDTASPLTTTIVPTTGRGLG